MGSLLTRSKALAIVLFFGTVSLLADITYEGARGIIPGFLGFLGASAAITTLIGGVGDFIAQAPRFLVGIIVHVTGRYWLFTFLGYALTLTSIPLLCLAHRWELAAILIILDRLGKSLRAPARDALFSGVSKYVGHGLGFGIAELLDQVGAIIGPLYVALALMTGLSYQSAFAYLFIPSIIALTILYITYTKYPREVVEVKEVPRDLSRGIRNLKLIYWKYIAIVTLSVLGVLHIFPLLYRARELAIAPEWILPILYLVAMTTDALIAVPAGLLFDKIGMKIIYLLYPLTIFIPISITFMNNIYGFIIASILYGMVLGIHESALKACVAQLTSPDTRGLAYGIYSTTEWR